jgi:hypothetical protein
MPHRVHPMMILRLVRQQMINCLIKHFWKLY